MTDRPNLNLVAFLCLVADGFLASDDMLLVQIRQTADPPWLGMLLGVVTKIVVALLVYSTIISSLKRVWSGSQPTRVFMMNCRRFGTRSPTSGRSWVEIPTDPYRRRLGNRNNLIASGADRVNREITTVGPATDAAILVIHESVCRYSVG